MHALKTVFAALALVVATSSALSEPLTLGANAKKARSSAQATPAGEGGYYVPYIVGPDGKKYPIMEIPGSATVVSRQLIDDQQARTPGEALRNVSGVTVRGR